MGQSAPDSDDRHHLRRVSDSVLCAAGAVSKRAFLRVFYEGNIFVPDFHWQNFIDAWRKSKIGTAMLNSAIITAGTLGVTVITGGLAGYAIARYATRYNKFVFGLLIGCMMIPGIINTVPLYVLMRQINAIDTLWGMICVCSTLAMPGAVFIYATFIRACYAGAGRERWRSMAARRFHLLARDLSGDQACDRVVHDSQRLRHLEQLCARRSSSCKAAQSRISHRRCPYSFSSLRAQNGT